MIVGTAGHIDHGKTTLVRALTGVDTDRLPEEKARGISIELGYAYSPLDNGEVLGFVDVPGHERFVHTMLSGATGIDFALLVVAVDDGVMPQTREHLNILLLLGIASAAIALTKIDRVDDARVAAVEHELRALLAGTAFADAPIFPVSGRTGAGIEALQRFLSEFGQQRDRHADNAHFRLAIDRSFTLPGVGTVVTGTVHSGQVQVGANMLIAPSGLEVRVRSIHAQSRPAEFGSTGQRCALNLAGIAREDVVRGDWIVEALIGLATERFDARLTLLADEPKALRSGTNVHVHCGAAHAPARLVVLDDDVSAEFHRDELAPGTNRLVQLILQRPIAAWHGDRFIVRDASATRTIGGGRVLDPFAPVRYRRSPERLAVLAALEAATPGARLAALVEQASFGVDLKRFARAGNVRNLDAYIGLLAARRVTTAHIDFFIDNDHWCALQQHAVEALVAFHGAHPDELGPDRSRLRRIAFPRLEATLYEALVADLVAAGKVRRSGLWLHLPEHDNAPTAQERALVEKILPRLLDVPFDPPWVRDLAKGAAQPEVLVRAAMLRASKRGEMFQIVRDLFYHPVAIRRLAVTANSLCQVDGEVRAAAFRDATSLGRKRAIQILEFFDRVGFTRRVHDKHLVRAENLLAFDVRSTAPSGVAGKSSVNEQRTA
jgi:selenocysteine-specific elongation factor